MFTSFPLVERYFLQERTRIAACLKRLPYFVYALIVIHFVRAVDEVSDCFNEVTVVRTDLERNVADTEARLKNESRQK